MKKFVCAATFFAVLMLPLAAHADVVKSFHSDVTVSRDNVVSVKETIIYDPQDGSHHGIYRFVPAQFKDAAGHTYYTTIKFYSVTGDTGAAAPLADQYANRTQLYLKIGDKDVLLSNTTHTYVISYDITPLVIKADGYDRFIFNVTGQQWDMPIERADATIHFPTSVTAAACYTGASGSITHDCQVKPEGSTVTVTTLAGLSYNQGLTVDVKLPPESVTMYLQPDVKPPLSATDKATVAASLLAILLAVFAGVRTMWQWWQDRRERQAQTIIPLYEPPDGLHPAQMSVLESPAQDLGDVASTIIDMAVRGYLKVELVSAKTWYRNANYRLTKLKEGDGLVSFERELFNAFFSSGDSLEMASIKGNMVLQLRVSTALKHFREYLGKDMKTKGYYTTSPTYGVWIFRLAIIAAAVLVPIILIVVVISGDSYSPVIAAIALALSAVGLGMAFIRTDRTLLGNQEWAKVEGFKWFLSVTEKDRLKFTDAPDKTPELFSKMLPYAIALKVENQWAKQFEGIDISQSVGVWYVGNPGSFSGTAFASDLSSSFSGAVSSSFAGSSGGGSAGGGGGGGGGGGW